MRDGHHHRVRLDLFDEPQRFQVLGNLLPRREAIHPLVRPAVFVGRRVRV